MWIKNNKQLALLYTKGFQCLLLITIIIILSLGIGPQQNVPARSVNDINSVVVIGSYYSSKERIIKIHSESEIEVSFFVNPHWQLVKYAVTEDNLLRLVYPQGAVEYLEVEEESLYARIRKDTLYLQFDKE